jgi:hypothetical protein
LWQGKPASYAALLRIILKPPSPTFIPSNDSDQSFCHSPWFTATD